MKALLRWVLCWQILVPLLVQAEEKKGELPPPGYFRLISWEGTEEGVYYMRGDKKIAVRISPFAKSEHYPLPQNGIVVFLKDSMDGAGNLRAAPVGQASVRADWKYPLLLASLGKEGMSFSVYNEDPAQFKAGQIRIINLTKETLGAQLSGREVTVGPEQMQTLDIQPKEREVVDVGLWAEKAGSRQSVYQRGWELEPKMRISALVIKDGEGRIRVKRFKEDQSTFLPRKSEEEAESQPVAQ